MAEGECSREGDVIVVTASITRDQAGDAARTLLDRGGVWARFDVAGLSLRLVLTRADL